MLELLHVERCCKSWNIGYEIGFEGSDIKLMSIFLVLASYDIVALGTSTVVNLLNKHITQHGHRMLLVHLICWSLSRL